jgi:hypothetical protein
MSTRVTHLRAAVATLVVSLVVVLTALPLLAQRGPYDPPPEAPGRGMITSFDAQLDANRQAVFRWSFAERYRDQNLVCTLDPEGDGIAQVSIEDCATRTEIAFTYDDPGEYEAVLLARASEGGSDRATARVHVR